MAAHLDLVSELKSLRKGRGLYVNNIDERVGRTLRDLCGVTERHDSGEIRERVAQRLESLADDLPEDLRLATLAAFALVPAARLPLYQERVGWVAQRIGRDPRTARRRIDDAIRQLAELAHDPLHTPVEPGNRWHTALTRVFLTVEGPTTEVLEHHRIVSEQDDLKEIELVTVFGDRAVLNGGAARANTLTLPAPMPVGQSHEFWVRSRSPVKPQQFLYMPRRRCDCLELRIHFDPDDLPRAVSRVQGRPPRDHGSVTLDRAGEVTLVFHDPAIGTTYGARWD